MIILIYLLKVSACTAIFFIVYKLLLSKLTFFNLNRVYLLLLLMVSFTIPAITLEHRQEVIAQEGNEINTLSYSKNPSAEKDDVEQENKAFFKINQSENLIYIYYLVLGVLLVRSLFLYGYVRYQLKKNKIYSSGSVIAVNEDSKIKNCSFLNKIIVDHSLPKEQQQLIIQHETIHVLQGHSVDKLLANLAVSILWFNPFIYLWRNEIDHVHEYLADEATTELYDKRQYASLLLQLAMPSSGFSTNSFSNLPLKSRISMMYKKPHANRRKLMYLAIIPVVIVCCTAFINHKDVVVNKVISLPLSVKQEKAFQNKLVEIPIDSTSAKGFKEKTVPLVPNLERQEEIKNTIAAKQLVLVVDAGHGGKDDATESLSGIKEKDLNLNAAKILKEEAEKRNIKVVLTRDKDEYVALRDRLPDENATALISIHHNSTPNAVVKAPFNGIEVLVSKLNPKIKIIETFATNVLSALNQLQGIEVNSSLRNANLLLLREAKIPSIMIELGNIEDEKSLTYSSKEKNLRRISNLILDGFVKFSKS